MNKKEENKLTAQELNELMRLNRKKKYVIRQEQEDVNLEEMIDDLDDATYALLRKQGF